MSITLKPPAFVIKDAHEALKFIALNGFNVPGSPPQCGVDAVSRTIGDYHVVVGIQYRNQQRVGVMVTGIRRDIATLEDIQNSVREFLCNMQRNDGDPNSTVEEISMPIVKPVNN